LKICLPNTASYENDRLFIELSSYQANKKDVLPISFRPRLPETTSYYLLVFYTIFIISIALILILPNLFVFKLIKDDIISCSHPCLCSLLALPVAFGIVLFLYYVK